jgi:signal transduction histidine kinase
MQRDGWLRYWSDPEIAIARFRFALSVACSLMIHFDPLIEWNWTRTIALDAWMLYAGVTLLALMRGWATLELETRVTTVADVLIALLVCWTTQATTGPFFVLSCFCVLSAGIRLNVRSCLYVTCALSLGFAVIVALMPAPHGVLAQELWMRPVYLGVTGTMISWLGVRYRRYIETQAIQLAEAEQRYQIARTLHDGSLQTFSALAMNLEAIRQACAQGCHDVACRRVVELREALDQEHDALRGYVYHLTERPTRKPVRLPIEIPTQFHVSIDATMSARTSARVDRVLRELIMNVVRHAQAQNASLVIREEGDALRILASDDGVGFGPGDAPPWSVASRVQEIGGTCALLGGPGARLDIRFPKG